MVSYDVTNPVEGRFLSKVPARPVGGCWVWEGTMFSTGYGAFCLKGQNRGAHRISHTLFKGPIPAGLVIDHLCRNRACVNPDHLEAVTPRENYIRGQATTAVAHRSGLCVDGRHDMTDVYVKDNGDRQCAPCQREKGRERRKT